MIQNEEWRETRSRPVLDESALWSGSEKKALQKLDIPQMQSDVGEPWL